MVAYTKDELKEQMLATYSEQNLSGGVVDLAAEILSNYLYLHQAEDLSIILEGSFLRSKLLNSRIQHAADNFYSVPRGSSQIVKINGLYMIGTSVDVKKFDSISSYGKYKMFYANDVVSKNPNEPISFNAYLSTGDKVEYTFTGDGKYYHDIVDKDDDNKLATDISEDLIVTKLIHNGDDVSEYEMIVTNSLSDLYEGEDAATDETKDPESAEKICVITTPNYGVRLWTKGGFKQTSTYRVTYLKCPDITIDEWTGEKGIASPDATTLLMKNIRSIPGYTKSESFEVYQEKSRVGRLEDLDAIYLYTANKVRFGGSIVSLNSLDELVREYFPELQGFNIVVGPADHETQWQNREPDPRKILETTSISSDDIVVYYTTGIYDDNGNEREVSKQKVSNFNALAKTYYITQNIKFTLAKRIGKEALSYFYVNESYGSVGTGGKRLLRVKIKYNNIIDYSRCEKIIRSEQNKIGQQFNPYQIIADLMSDSELLGKLTLVTVENVLAQQSSAEQVSFPDVYHLNANVRPYFPEECLEIIYEKN